MKIASFKSYWLPLAPLRARPHAFSKLMRSIKTPRLSRAYPVPSRIIRLQSTARGNTPKNSEMWWEKDSDYWTDVSTGPSLKEALHCEGVEICVVDWYATWCHGCRKTSPLLTELAADEGLSKRVQFIRACVDSMADFARKQGVKALPYVTIYDNCGKKLVGFGAGASKAKTFRSNIEKILDSPDMDYRLDPNGFVIALGKIQAKREQSNLNSDIEELRKFSASLSQKLGKDKPITEDPVLFRKKENGTLDLISERQAFLVEYGTRYGYNGLLDSIYQSEFGKRLGPNQHYMDYTGSSVYTLSQVEAIYNDRKQFLYGNPHSENPSASLTKGKIEEVRSMILKFFDADPRKYQVIFTTSTTAALKLIAETFPWNEDSTFRYLRENHNSVLGMREYVLKAGGHFESVAEEQVEEWIFSESSTPVPPLGKGESPVYHLFAYPAEDNFAGVKYPLSWIEKIHQKSNEQEIWKVALDAAAFVGTQPLSLKTFPADYVAISFYKMFGCPTGLGALLMRTDSIDILDKTFWAGGSVALATSHDNFHVLKCRPTERYEDGTVPFLEIISLKHGFDTIERFGGVHRIQKHVGALTEWLYRRLVNLQHSNGRPLVKIFGKHGHPNSSELQGSILNFELLGENGKVLSYKKFEIDAAKAGFHIRTGIECNPGAAYNYIGIEESEVESLAGLTEGCDDEMEYIQVSRSRDVNLFDSVDSIELKNLNLDDTLDDESEMDQSNSRMVNVPLGSVRVSLGYMSTFEDCLYFSQFLERHCKDQVLDRSPKLATT